MLDGMPEITSVEQFEKLILHADRPVVVTFYADWCGDCRRLGPHLAGAAERLGGKMDFYRVEDAHRDLEERCGVHLIPDVMVFVEGLLVRRWVNVTDGAEYPPALQGMLSSQPL